MKNVRLSLYIKADKVTVEGDAPIYMKIVYLNSKTTMNLGLKIYVERWKVTNQLKNTKVNSERKLRVDIDVIMLRVREIHNNLLLKEVPFSATIIKNVYNGKGDTTAGNKLMLSELFDKHIKAFEPLVESGVRAKESLRKYNTLRNHVYEFIDFEFKLDDVALKSLNYAFIESFDLFLRTNKGIGNNTTVKYVQAFRRLMNIAVKYDWLMKDPFILYDKKIKVKDAIFLSLEELTKIEKVKLISKRLEVVRDIFVFSCYTGYSPIDIHKLTSNSIVTGTDGQKWILAKRTKTGVNSDFPLLPVPEKIIKKYQNDPYCQEKSHLIPKRSTQKMNMYLKEIAEIAEINKSLHQYVSRHTFACTVILANGLSMEVLSKMLGHTNLKQTMHYGKIQNTRVGQEMLALRKKLED
jgi:site-specific recombinase XerD